MDNTKLIFIILALIGLLCIWVHYSDKAYAKARKEEEKRFKEQYLTSAKEPEKEPPPNPVLNLEKSYDEYERHLRRVPGEIASIVFQRVQSFKKPNQQPVVVNSVVLDLYDDAFGNPAAIASFISKLYNSVIGKINFHEELDRLLGGKVTYDPAFASLVHPADVPFTQDPDKYTRYCHFGRTVSLYTGETLQLARLSPKGIVTNTFKEVRLGDVTVVEVRISFGSNEHEARRWHDSVVRNVTFARPSEKVSVIKEGDFYFLAVIFTAPKRGVETVSSVLTWPMQPFVAKAFDVIKGLEATLLPDQELSTNAFKSNGFYNIVVEHRGNVVLISDSKAYFNNLQHFQEDKESPLIDTLMASKDLKRISHNHAELETVVGKVDWFCDVLPNN